MILYLLFIFCSKNCPYLSISYRYCYVMKKLMIYFLKSFILEKSTMLHCRFISQHHILVVSIIYAPNTARKRNISSHLLLTRAGGHGPEARRRVRHPEAQARPLPHLLAGGGSDGGRTGPARRRACAQGDRGNVPQASPDAESGLGARRPHRETPRSVVEAPAQGCNDDCADDAGSAAARRLPRPSLRRLFCDDTRRPGQFRLLRLARGLG